MKNTQRFLLEGEQPCHPGFQPAADTCLQRGIGSSCVFARARVTYFELWSTFDWKISVHARVDPEARSKDPKGAIDLASLKDHVKMMAELNNIWFVSSFIWHVQHFVSKGSMNLAWLRHHVKTIAELANIWFVKNLILKGAMNLAWLKDHVKTMAELAK